MSLLSGRNRRVQTSQTRDAPELITSENLQLVVPVSCLLGFSHILTRCCMQRFGTALQHTSLRCRRACQLRVAVVTTLVNKSVVYLSATPVAMPWYPRQLQHVIDTSSAASIERSRASAGRCGRHNTTACHLLPLQRASGTSRLQDSGQGTLVGGGAAKVEL
jgi:hypothetical protein